MAHKLVADAVLASEDRHLQRLAKRSKPGGAGVGSPR
jgi:hypothetical protein